jgi:O-antigen/teichoic acid export membrane protein
MLTPTDYSVFMGFWALMFGLGAISVALEQEASRLMVLTDESRRGDAVRALGRAAATVLLALLLLQAIGLVVTVRILDGSVWLLLLLGLGTTALVAQFLVRGVLLGLRELPLYAGLVVAEPLVRLAVLAVPFIVGWGLVAGAAAAAAGGLAVLFVLPGFLRLLRLPGTGHLTGITGNVLKLGASQLLAALMVTGFPAVARVAVGATAAAGLGPFFAALTLSRAPLIVLLLVQALFVPAFAYHLKTGGTGQAARLARRLLLVVLVLGGAASAGAYLIGPWLVEALFGGGYQVSHSLCLALAASATCQGVVTILAALLIALSRHSAVVTGWAVSTVAAVAVMAVPWAPVSWRLTTALFVAPLVATAIFVKAVVTFRSRLRGGG